MTTSTRYDNTEHIVAIFYDMVALNQVHRCFMKLHDNKILRNYLVLWKEVVKMECGFYFV